MATDVVETEAVPEAWTRRHLLGLEDLSSDEITLLLDTADRFKQAMGFLLMATLVWLLWVLGQQVGLDALASVMAFLLLLGFALWLYGSMLTLSSSTARRTSVWISVLALVVGGWWQFGGDRVSARV